MQAIFGIAYLAIGFVQLFAVQEWISQATSWGAIPSFVASLMVTYIPVVGSALGVLGAHGIWGWSWFDSLLLFYWYVPVFLIAKMVEKQ